MTTVRIPAHWQRSRKGKRYKVKTYRRVHRGKGTTFRFKDVGRYQVRFDNHGNFRGSRIIADHPAHWVSTKTRRTTSR